MNMVSPTQEVSLVDAGIYTCTATNELGNATASGALVVRREWLKLQE